MRALILLAGASLGLAACANNDQKDNTQNIDENLTAENIVSNDVTAIDAVTASDANMAADVNYMDVPTNGADDAAFNSSSGATAKSPSKKASKPAAGKPPAQPKPETTAATNSAE